MPSIAPVLTYPRQQGAGRILVATWGIPSGVTEPGGQTNTPAPLTDLNGEVIAPPPGGYSDPTLGVPNCLPLYCPGFASRVMEIVGVSGGTGAGVQGSNDGVNFTPLHDVFGNSLNGNLLPEVSPGTNLLLQILESPAWILPTVGPDGLSGVCRFILTCRSVF